MAVVDVARELLGFIWELLVKDEGRSQDKGKETVRPKRKARGKALA